MEWNNLYKHIIYKFAKKSMGKNIQIWIALLLVVGLKGQTTTWNGTAWSAGVPNANVDAIINGNYNVSANIAAKNFTINFGHTFTIAEGFRLLISGDFVNNGTIVVNNDAILTQLSDTSTYSGSGNAIVKRESNLRKNDYTFWSSPVSGQNLYNFSVGTPTNYFFRYNEPDDRFVTLGLNTTSVFEPGVGYAIKGKNTYSTTTPVNEIFTFNGIPNNGNISVTLRRSTGLDKGYNLVGNPYPSNIAFKVVYNNAGNKNSIFNKQWFWTNLNEIISQQGSNYSGNNYATFVSGVGGVGPTYISGSIEEITLRPLSYTKSSQGFLVQARRNNAILTFTNSMRVSTTTGSIFYNKSEDDEPEEEILNRYWLKFINPDNIANNILIAHIPEATNDFDEDYDSSLFTLGSDSFYSVIGTNKLQIQARALPIQDSDVIILGYKNSKQGTCVIALNDKEGVFKDSSKAIYLKDKLTGTVTNLQQGYYTFTSDVVTVENETRFEILYANDVLAAGNVTKEDLLVYKQNDALMVKNNFNISKAELFDASGKLITSLSGNNTKEIKLSTVGFVKGVYILKITSEKGITTKKVIL